MKILLNIIPLVLISSLLIYLGFFMIFKTNILINFYIKYSRIKENSHLLKFITNNSNRFWFTIIGIAIIFYSMTLFSIVVYKVVSNKI